MCNELLTVYDAHCVVYLIIFLLQCNVYNVDVIVLLCVACTWCSFGLSSS